MFFIVSFRLFFINLCIIYYKNIEYFLYVQIILKKIMSKTIHRILKIVEQLGISARQFDMSIGTANGYTLRMSKNNASVGSDVIERIKEVYPQINLVWLITGKGDMFVENSKQVLKTPSEIETYIDKRIKDRLSQEKSKLLNEILREIEDLRNKD